MRLKGSTAKQLSAFCEVVHSLCLEKFGEEVKRKKSDGLKQPNRRQVRSKVRKSTTAWQNRPPSSLLPYPHPTPPQPHPSPTLSLPPPTTSIPIPSSAYRASRSTCCPQWHHPLAQAAGGARVWGTTGSRRNHLTRSGRWLTRVMSRQLLLHVVCIYCGCVLA